MRTGFTLAGLAACYLPPRRALILKHRRMRPLLSLDTALASQMQKV